MEIGWFFSSGRQEHQETPITLHQTFTPSHLLLKTMPGQRNPWLPLPSLGSFQAGMKRADRQHWAPKPVSLPPSPGRGVHEEGEESPACSGGCKSEDDFHACAPGKPNDSPLPSRLAACFLGRESPRAGAHPQHGSLSTSLAG